MTLTQMTTTLRAPVNEGNPGLFSALVAWLAAHPAIMIQDADVFRPQSTYAADVVRLRLAYTESVAPAVGATWSAKLYQSQGVITAQAAFVADFSGGITLVPVFTLDITNHERTFNDPGTLLVIGVDTGSIPLGMVGHSRAAFIAQAEEIVAAGASGLMTVFDAGGRTLGTGIQVRNVGVDPWPIDQRNYIIQDDITGELMGLPSCCAPDVPLPSVSSTTTTLYPCPAYLPGADIPVP